MFLKRMPIKCKIMAEKQDIRENAMSGGTPARLRGLAANGNSISPTVAEVMNAMPVANMERKGLAEICQGRTLYSLGPNEFVDIPVLYYGIYMFVNETIDGVSLLIQIAYSKANTKIILDPSGIQGLRFKLEKLNDGDKSIRVTNLNSTTLQRFSLNRL